MANKEFLTPEQRKGLIYGSLISAILSGGTTLKSGGDITSALGRGTMGAAQAFGGGIEEIAKYKHQDIENAKMEEMIAASKESQVMARKKQIMEEEAHKKTQLYRAAQTKALSQADLEKTSDAQALQKFIASQRPVTPESTGGIPPPELTQAATPEQTALIAALGSRGHEGVQALIKPTTASDLYYNEATNQMRRASRTEQPRAGEISPVLAAIGMKAKAAEPAATKAQAATAANVATRTTSAETIAKESAAARVTAAEKKAEAPKPAKGKPKTLRNAAGESIVTANDAEEADARKSGFKAPNEFTELERLKWLTKKKPTGAEKSKFTIIGVK